jgi:hypothetical protein
MPKSIFTFTKDTIINALIQDYEEYLDDFNEEELNKIVNSGSFTLREAIEEG